MECFSLLFGKTGVNTLSKALEKFIYSVFGIMALSAIAIYNGYPLVTSDTGSYINHAFDFQIPADRSPFYGVFLGISSLWKSLWVSIIIQAAILSVLLYEYMQLVYAGKLKWGYGVVILITIVAGTAVSWFSASLMPDVFAAMLLLSVLVYLLKHKDKYSTVFVFSAMIIALYVHNSHFLILLTFSAGLILISVIKRYRILLRKSVILLGVSLLSIGSMCMLNYVKGFGFTLSSGSPIFMMGKLGETGILKEYLDENCETHNYKMCAYRNEIPEHAWDFLWYPESPLYKTGGWDSGKAEYKKIISGVFSQPKYVKAFVGKSITSTIEQLGQNTLSIQELGEGTSPWISINKYIPREIEPYEQSKQNTGGLKAGFFNYLYLAVFIISMIWVVFVARKSENRDFLVVLYTIVIIFLLSNAFVTATFANVLDRLQNRVFWVLPTTNIIVIFQHYLRRKEVEGASRSL
jgi:hypothetical protein